MRRLVWEIAGRVHYPYTCCIINNQLAGFLDEFSDGGEVKLLDVRSGEGRRTYERTLAFLVAYVLDKKNLRDQLKIEHSYGDTLYGEVRGVEPKEAVQIIKSGLSEVIQRNLRIEKLELTKAEAISIFQREKRADDLRLLKYLVKDVINVYKMDNFFAYFAGPLLPETSFIKIYDVVPYGPGFLIVLPSRDNPEKLAEVKERIKLFETFQESKRWAEILAIEDVGYLNDAIYSMTISELIKIQEALHEKKIGKIADVITENYDRIKLILISGPSSSGKTTFAKRLKVHLRVNGLMPKTISLDNYFVDREYTPRDEDGNLDFDAFEALDYRLFIEHVKKLLEGEEVEIPAFDFKEGRRKPHGSKIKMEKGDILIVEGIHALNPRLTEGVDDSVKFKIYVSALTQLNIDRINRIPTRDTRLIRRIVRDFRYRGHTALETLKMWPKVIRGEEKNIFPYQEEADVMFNSALVYELAVLKNYAEPLLRSIDSSEPEYSEALRLLNFLFHFLGVMPDEVPPTSILREFIGGSSFVY